MRARERNGGKVRVRKRENDKHGDEEQKGSRGKERAQRDKK